IFERELAPLFKKRHVRWLLDRPSALFGLGIPPSQFTALKGSEASMADVLEARLERLACGFDLADNYFAWQAFGRGYASGGTARRPRDLPHCGGGDDPTRTRAGRAARPLRLRSRGMPAVDGEGPLVDLRRLPPLRVPGMKKERALAHPGVHAGAKAAAQART